MFLAVNFTGQCADVLTQHNDNGRSGAMVNEVLLSPQTVNTTDFGELYTLPVDGEVYAQPLYVHGVQIPNVGTRNVIIIATEHNSVFAFDADYTNGAQPLWQVNLGPSISSTVFNCTDLTPELGITSTPVIDKAANSIFVEAASLESGSFIHRLHALNLSTGAELANSPVVITASVSGTAPNDPDAVDGQVFFNPETQNNRPGLLLSNGQIYIAYASHCDHPYYHGWIMSYSEAALKQTGVVNTTPNGNDGGIWQSGNGLAADSSGNVYAMTGNGTFDADGGGTDYGDSMLRLRLGAGGLQITDFFTPHNEATMEMDDYDLGSGGPVLIPSEKWVLGGGKTSELYVLNQMALGGFDALSDPGALEVFGIDPIFTSPVYWSDGGQGYLYECAVFDYLKCFTISNGSVQPTPVSESTDSANYPGGALSISSNGTEDASCVVWESQLTSTTLRAYNGMAVSQELWDSNKNTSGRDALPPLNKYTPPTIADGKVIEATSSREVVVYGLFRPMILSQPVATTALIGGSATFSGSAAGSINPITYQWLYGGSPITGATNSSLTLTRVMPPQAGIYNIEASSPQGTVESLPAVLSVISLPDAAGAYSGGIAASGLPGSTEGVITLRLTRSGAFTGTIRDDGRTYHLAGSFARDGVFSGLLDHGKAFIDLGLSVSEDSNTVLVTGTLGLQGSALQVSATQTFRSAR